MKIFAMSKSGDVLQLNASDGEFKEIVFDFYGPGQHETLDKAKEVLSDMDNPPPLDGFKTEMHIILREE